MEEQCLANESHAEKEVHRGKCATKPWRLVIPFTVIAAGFYAQGRAYYEGYLSYFGISTSQFPLSTTDTYWEALKGWSIFVGKGVPAVWNAYPQYLLAVWMPLLFVVVVSMLLGLAERYGWLERMRLSSRSARVKTALKSRPLGLALLAMLTWVLAVPALVMMAMLFVALIIVAMIVPFDGLGHTGAQQYCETAAARVPVAHFVDDSNPLAGGPAGAAHILQCSTDFCALIRAGEVFVIPRDAVKRVDGVEIMSSGATAKAKAVPKKDQLCYKPDESH
jgi:hypothetical protein